MGVTYHCEKLVILELTGAICIDLQHTHTHRCQHRDVDHPQLLVSRQQHAEATAGTPCTCFRVITTPPRTSSKCMHVCMHVNIITSASIMSTSASETCREGIVNDSLNDGSAHVASDAIRPNKAIPHTLRPKAVRTPCNSVTPM